VKWIEKVKKFYSVLNTDKGLQERLSRLQVSAEDIENGLIQIKELEASRDTYTKEKGQSQNATKMKNSTLVQMSDWMDDFYKMAKLAFRDQPQLLEALGKVVKS
jgi:hypothetical protein